MINNTLRAAFRPLARRPLAAAAFCPTFMPVYNPRMFSFSWPCPRKLREIVKMSAFEKETADTCTMIWNEYHHAKPHTVSTVLTVQQYE
mmetsp:Transcript_34985/g.53704  ORF Transcript_34985/g.53704 Transcript_34985/m.53704 type:complete len:89 (-) Transcript_34985:469-735(-)